MITIKEILENAVLQLLDIGIESPQLDAQIILSYITNRSKEYLISHPEAIIDLESYEKFLKLLEKRKNGCPIAYLTNKKEFYGIELIVKEGVLIPRPETEILIETAIKEIKKNRYRTIADIGVGSGAISIALAKKVNNIKIYAIDKYELPVFITKQNIEKYLLSDKIELYLGDLLCPLIHNNLFVDVIISNPPYVKSSDIENLKNEIKNWEPLSSLDGGYDGLRYYKKILSDSYKVLNCGGMIIFEIGVELGRDIAKLANMHNYKSVEVIKDYSKNDRVVVIK